MSLSSVDSPNIFGLHIAADTSYRNRETVDLIDSVTAMQPKDSGGGGESPDQFVSNKCMDFSEKLKEVEVNVMDIRRLLSTRAAPYIKDDGRNKPDKGLAAPLNIFL